MAPNDLVRFRRDGDKRDYSGPRPEESNVGLFDNAQQNLATGAAALGRNVREQLGGALTAAAGVADVPAYVGRQGLRTIANIGRGFVGAPPNTDPINFRAISNAVGNFLLPGAPSVTNPTGAPAPTGGGNVPSPAYTRKPDGTLALNTGSQAATDLRNYTETLPGNAGLQGFTSPAATSPVAASLRGPNAPPLGGDRGVAETINTYNAGIRQATSAAPASDIITTSDGRQIYFGGRVPIYEQGPAQYHPVTGAKISTGQRITGYRDVYKDLNTGETFGSRGEAEAGSPAGVVKSLAAAEESTATAGLRRTQAEVLPADTASQIGYRGALGEAALTTAEATGLRAITEASAPQQGRAPRTFTQKVASSITGGEFNREYVEQALPEGGTRYVPVSSTIPQETLRRNNSALLKQLRNIDPDRASVVERRFENVEAGAIDQALLYDELQGLVTRAQVTAR